MKTSKKVPITERALVARIRRRLAKAGELLRRTRGIDHNLGAYYRVNVDRNFVVATHVDPEALGRELGVVHPWEALAQ